MPQILISGLSVLFFISELFKSVKLSKRAKYIIAGVLLFIVFRKAYKAYQEAQASEKALGTANGTLAVQLHEAIFSQGTRLKLDVPLVGELFNIHVGNGDEEKILEISKKITDYEGVAEQYKLIYNEDLTKDLAKVLDATEIGQFNANVNASKTIPSGGGSGGTTTTPTNPTGFKKGDIVYSKGGWNLRDTDSPYEPEDKTVAGEDWILWNNPYYATIGNTAGWWVVVEQPKSRYTFYPSYYVVSLNALYKK
jgi:hypothetical protein